MKNMAPYPSAVLGGSRSAAGGGDDRTFHVPIVAQPAAQRDGAGRLEPVLARRLEPPVPDELVRLAIQLDVLKQTKSNT